MQIDEFISTNVGRLGAGHASFRSAGWVENAGGFTFTIANQERFFFSKMCIRDRKGKGEVDNYSSDQTY